MERNRIPRNGLLRLLTIVAIMLFASSGDLISQDPVMTYESESDYFGNLGDENIDIRLFWEEDQVVGSMRVGRYKPVSLTFAGTTIEQGQLEAEVSKDEVRVGSIQAIKSLSDTQVIWEGEMTALDGEKKPIRFARNRITNIPRNPSFPVDFPYETVYFTNILETEGIILRWEEDGTISGTSASLGGMETIYRIKGRNPREGVLEFDEYSKGKIVASYSLSRKLTRENILWEGTRKPVGKNGEVNESEVIPVALQRLRNCDVEINDVDPYVAAGKMRIASMARLQTWNSFPEAETEGGVFMKYPESVWTNFTLTDCKKEKGRTTLKLLVWLRLNLDHAVPWGPEVEIEISREIPYTPEELIGSTHLAWIHESGEILEFELDAILITHWRIGDDGLVEIRGVIDRESGPFDRPLPDAKIDYDYVEVRPDKVALAIISAEDAEKTPFIPLREFMVSKKYGIVIKTRYAGAGALELESLSLDVPQGDKKWIPVFVEDGDDKLPASQRAKDAG